MGKAAAPLRRVRAAGQAHTARAPVLFHYHLDRRAPCSFMDNPDVLKGLVERHKAKATHDGAESLICELHGPLEERAERYKRLLEELDEDDTSEVRTRRADPAQQVAGGTS